MVSSFLAGTMDGGEKKKKVLLCQKPLKKAKEFRRAEDQAPEKEVCTKDALKGKEEAYL